MAQHQAEFDTGVRADEIEPGRSRPMDTPWGPMALFRVDDQVFCVQAFCLHLQGPLFQGSVAAGVVTCPWHGWRFRLSSGRRVDLAGRLCGAERLARCRVAVSERGTLVLRAPDNAAP